MRTFVAIDFSERLKEQICLLQNKLRPLASSGRWKYKDNFHLTLKFLGDTDSDEIKCIDERISSLTENMTNFRLNISGLGNFPGRGNIRVLWLDINGGLERLFKLQSAIDGQLSECGFEAEKRSFTPHVTIGQELDFKCGFEEIKRIASGLVFEEIFVDRVYLVKSEQIGSKRVYTPIREYAFGK